jgi:hypothetical protein
MKRTLVTLMIACSSAAYAEQGLPEGFYAGGGVNYNDLDFGSVFDGAGNESAMGFQLFAGLPLENNIEGFDTFFEAGYFRTSDFDFGFGVKEKVTGIWGSAVMTKDLNEINPNLYAIGRAGIDLGDDDGLFMGIGAGLRVNPQVDLRAEFVNKDLITSYQLNAIFRF